MCQFGHHTRDEWHTEQVKYMSDTIVGYRLDDRIAGDDFSVAHCRRVSIIGSLHVGGENFTKFWKLHDGFCCDNASLGTLML